MNGTICYCKGNDCNKGDIDNPPTPPPTDKLRCLKCMAEDDCFNNPDVDGESTTCKAPENTGCYKALLGKPQELFLLLSYCPTVGQKFKNVQDNETREIK